MARTSTYLNFNRTAQEAFNFYKSVFGGEFIGPIHRMKDTPAQEGYAPKDEDRELIIHVELAITGGHVLMGADAPESMGITLVQGNSAYLNIEPDTREEADRLFTALSAGGTIDMPMQEMFWGAYFGSCKDKFGTCWMINFQHA